MPIAVADSYIEKNLKIETSAPYEKRNRFQKETLSKINEDYNKQTTRNASSLKTQDFTSDLNSDEIRSLLWSLGGLKKSDIYFRNQGRLMKNTKLSEMQVRRNNDKARF